MIPQKLSLTNFMCYREAALDFSGIHVACLTGENGAGKSALLDAITWALWGSSRLGARGDDDLVRLGEDKMQVAFTFSLGGQAYRVLRRREVAKYSRTLLDFQVDDDGHWRSLVEGGVRATQRKIENVLRLDYDTFVNSAFLRQGRADEFTVKTAAERKRVLGDILGLDRWSIYEDRVKERQRMVEAEMEAIKLRLEEIQTELGRRSEYEAQLEAAQVAVDELAERLEEAQRDYQRIEAARTELRHLEMQIADQIARAGKAEEELTSVREEQAKRERHLNEYEQLLAHREEIEAGYQAYREAVGREQKLGARLRQSVELDERRREIESQISEARHQLEAKRNVIGKRIDELKSRLPGDALLEELDEVEAQLDHLDRLSESREAAKNDLARIAEERAALQARNEGLRREMEALKERIELLREADARCPLCEQPLTEEHRVELLRQIEGEGKGKGDAFRANQATMEDLVGQASALEREIARSDRELSELSPLQRQEAALIERVERGREAAAELEETRIALVRLDGRLDDEDYASDLRAELRQVLQEAEELGYDSEAHEEARKAVAEGQVFAERKAKLETVRERIEEERSGLERLSEAEERWEEELTSALERREALEEEVEGLRKRLEDAPLVEEKLQEMRGKEARARQRLGAAQQRLAACESLEQQLTDKLERKETLVEKQAIYDELRTAFGVQGVPAMIIEAAVPEIEAEANRLLSRMTNGRMHLRFDTQRETKAGEVREALEIQISDDLGTRPYENYSGGEQFRVNFAIRIGLSKLLARRAGAQLQTLVIDEGFGTQDAQGRERLVEAINTVQDDFSRILVITHINELKDTFPARIEVTKTPEGSKVELF
jgi:exonuclease SbcC